MTVSSAPEPGECRKKQSLYVSRNLDDMQKNMITQVNKTIAKLLKIFTLSPKRIVPTFFL